MNELFNRMYNAVGKLSCAALHGPQYADENCIDIAEECSFLIAAIQKLEQAPKKGKWKDLGYNDEWYGRCYTCSVCNAEMIGAENYCPNCGSYMKEDKE